LGIKTKTMLHRITLMNEDRSLVSIVLLALTIGMFTFLLATQGNLMVGCGRHPMYRGDLEIYYTLKAVISSINAFLLIVISSIYWKNYVDTGLEFSLGLVVFSVALLMYSLVANPLIIGVAGYRASGLGPFAVLPEIFTLIASLTLLYISR